MFNSEPSPAEFGQFHGGDDHIPPDPLLETGAFIDPHANPNDQAEPVAEESTPASAAEAEATPTSRRNRRTLEDTKAEGRPDWLPEDWIMDLKVRNSGATAGTVDRYYKEPGSGKRFRSKNEVLHYLETGSKIKKRPAADGDNMPSGSTGVPKKKNPPAKKSKKEAAATGGFSFNFGEPPEMVTWSLEDAGEEERWSASIDGEKVAESTQREWTAVFDHLSTHKP